MSKPTFRIVTEGNGSKARYIDQLYINGEMIDRNYLTYDELKAGGKLIFKMSKEPNKSEAPPLRQPPPHPPSQSNSCRHRPV